ncbi:MAG: endonuclease domain-containing protein [Burkholderiales bacterium]
MPVPRPLPAARRAGERRARALTRLLTPCEGGREPKASGGLVFLSVVGRAPISGAERWGDMRPIRPFFRYRRDLKARSRELRHDATAAEKRLWFDFLSAHRQKFTKQKPLGHYIADFYCARARLVIEVDGDSHFTGANEQYDQHRTERSHSWGSV